jgi:hypothetical protein
MGASIRERRRRFGAGASSHIVRDHRRPGVAAGATLTAVAPRSRRETTGDTEHRLLHVFTVTAQHVGRVAAR